MAESIIGKNLDNITNVAKGIDKEFLDMTYPDKYYRDVINPAKLGKAPIPSKMEMIGQSIKSFGPVKAMFIGAQRGKYGERAMPTKPAQKFLDTLGSAAKFGIKRVAPVLSIFAPTEMGAAEITPEMRQSLEMGIPNTKNFQNMDTRGIMNPELLDKFDRSPASSGLRETIGSRITEGLGSIRDTVTDKFGGGLEFLKNLSPVQNIINAVKRGDESTRGIAGLNVNDVFNIDSFGSDEDPTKDPYGINIVSAKGDYNAYVKNKARELAKMQFRTKTGQQRQKFYEDAAEKVREKEAAELRAALQRAQQEINRMGYQDYGSGGGLDPSLNDPVTGEYTGASKQDYGSGE